MKRLLIFRNYEILDTIVVEDDAIIIDLIKHMYHKYCKEYELELDAVVANIIYSTERDLKWLAEWRFDEYHIRNTVEYKKLLTYI